MEHDYIDDQLDAKIIQINNQNNIYEIGTVVNVKDFIVEVTGINNVLFYEKINIANKALGYVNSINENTVTVAVLKIDAPINVGDTVYSTNTLYQGSFSPSSFGRVVDLFGTDKLSGKKFSDLMEIPIERKTIPIMDRGTVNRPLLTGITGIDLMYPIGKGQRQLIIGDKRTGKTQIGLDTIVNQKGKNVLCFYVAIGKTKKEVKNIYAELTKKGALDYTIIFTAFNDELPPVISLVPYFALSVAENYMMDGYDVLVIIDDLKRHAEAYREISLISGKTPGRDAYPADIFYTHSRLLEKGCQHKNGGSITILPIVETKGGDITDYISTNIISITDGQIVLSEKSFQKGEKPAIDYGLSVSRLGGAVQEKNMKIVGSAVRRKLLSYLETRSVYELVNMDEMSFELKNQFMEGKIILDNMMQYKFSPKSPEEMMDLFVGFVETDDEDDTNNTEVSTKNSVPPINDTSTQIQSEVPNITSEVTPLEGTDTVVVDYKQNTQPEFNLADLNKMPEEIPFEPEQVADASTEINNNTQEINESNQNTSNGFEPIDLSSNGIAPLDNSDINQNLEELNDNSSIENEEEQNNIEAQPEMVNDINSQSIPIEINDNLNQESDLTNSQDENNENGIQELDKANVDTQVDNSDNSNPELVTTENISSDEVNMASNDNNSESEEPINENSIDDSPVSENYDNTYTEESDLTNSEKETQELDKGNVDTQVDNSDNSNPELVATENISSDEVNMASNDNNSESEEPINENSIDDSPVSENYDNTYTEESDLTNSEKETQELDKGNLDTQVDNSDNSNPELVATENISSDEVNMVSNDNNSESEELINENNIDDSPVSEDYDNTYTEESDLYDYNMLSNNSFDPSNVSINNSLEIAENEENKVSEIEDGEEVI